MNEYDEILEKQQNGKELKIKEKLILLEHDIEHYCGDWGTLESSVETTFNNILEILKNINDKLEG
jgi:hypothetical protein